MNKILLGYTAIGPTYKDRVIHHITKYLDCYKYFDIIILTNDPDYLGFNKIKHLDNIIIEDLNAHREQFPEFLEYEVLVEEKISDEVYRNQALDLISEGIAFPLHLQRFILNYKNIANYRIIAMLDCDVAPVHDSEIFENLLNYIEKMPNNSVSSNKAYYTWQNHDRVVEFVLDCIKELDKKNTKSLEVIEGFDNPFKLFKFESEQKIKDFFNTWNYCLLKAFKTDFKNYVIPKNWGDASEIIISICYTIENIIVNKEYDDYITMNGFRTYTYPEDRFWNDVSGRGLNTSAKSKKEFIRMNYDALKKFYLDYGQDFTDVLKIIL